MIYEQILPSKGTKSGKVKRLFQIIGFLHFFFGFVFALFLVFIYWKFALIPLFLGLLGFAWGSVAYLISFDFKYIYKDGIFAVYRLNSYNKYVRKLEFETKDVEFVGETKCKVYTNQKNRIYLKADGNIFAISPDDYMLSLLKNGN